MVRLDGIECAADRRASGAGELVSGFIGAKEQEPENQVSQVGCWVQQWVLLMRHYRGSHNEEAGAGRGSAHRGNNCDLEP